MSFVDHDPRIFPAQRFFFLVDLAMVLFLVWAVLSATGTGTSGLRMVLWLAWALLLGVMFFRRGQDEFWNLCWRRAAVTTFAGLLFVPPLFAFGHGLYDGFTTEHAADAGLIGTVAREPFSLDYDVIFVILFTIFFGRFQWTRFRGGMD